mgnify:CR=1 FL=1
MGQKTLRARRSGFSLALLARAPLASLLAIAALAIQVFVVAPHVDGLALHGAGVEARAVAQTADHAAPVCLICQEAAVARAAVLASPPAIGVVERTLFLSATPPALPVLETRPARPWQSRAPPLSA